MFYYLEKTDLIEYRTYGYAWYNPIPSNGRTHVVYRKLRYMSITFKMQKVIHIYKDC